MAHWLMKSDPTYFLDDLIKVKREGWDSVQNYQARNFMREMKKVIVIFTIATPPGAAGVAKIVKEAEPPDTI